MHPTVTLIMCCTALRGPSQQEGSTSWDPKEINALVGDTVQFEWSSYEAVYEVQSDGATAVVSGAKSGDPTVGGGFSHRLMRQGTFYFRAANKGFVVKVNVGAAGLPGHISDPRAYTMQTSGVLGGCYQRWYGQSSSNSRSGCSPFGGAKCQNYGACICPPRTSAASAGTDYYVYYNSYTYKTTLCIA